MTNRYTKGLLSVIAIASTVLLTSCSNPDTSGGVTLSKGADDANEFPHGSCEGRGKNTHDYDTGCGWISYSEKSYYIEPNSNFQKLGLWGLDLSGANLRGASFVGVNVMCSADLTGVIANSSTICPNGIKWGTAGNDCGF